MKREDQEAARRRLALLQQVETAASEIDVLVRLVAEAGSEASAVSLVRTEFGIDEVAATYVVDMPLRLLVGHGVRTRREEIANLLVQLRDVEA